MMLALPPVAAAARALAVAAAAGGLVEAETHPPVTRAPANTAMASTDTKRFLSMTGLSIFLNDESGAITGRRAGLNPGLGVAAGEQRRADGEHDHRVGAEHRELAPCGEHVRADTGALGAR